VSPRRPERVADVVRQVLARLLREQVRDPRVGFVTLTDVKLSPDLRHAVAYVTLLDHPQQALAALNHAVPFLRRSLAREAGLRFTPDLRFVRDEGVESGQRLEQVLERLRRERGADGDDDPSPTVGDAAPEDA